MKIRFEYQFNKVSSGLQRQFFSDTLQSTVNLMRESWAVCEY